VKPVPGASDCHKFSPREYRFNGWQVGICNVLRSLAAHKKSRFIIASCGDDRLGQVIIIFGDLTKIDPPLKTAGRHSGNIFHQKLSERGLGNGRREGRVDFAETLKTLQLQLFERRQ